MVVNAGNLAAKTDLGQSLMLLGRYGEASTLLDERSKTGDTLAQAYLGCVLFILGSYKRALYHLSEASKAGEPLAKIGEALISVKTKYDGDMPSLWKKAKAGDVAAREKYLKTLIKRWDLKGVKTCTTGVLNSKNAALVASLHVLIGVAVAQVAT